MEQEFTAPWGRLLRFTTALSLAVLGVIVAIGLCTGPRQLLLWQVALVYVPIGVAVAGWFFRVTGYTLTDRALIVKRPGWSVTVPFDGLKSVGADPEMLQGTLRLFGNGGHFVYAGWFWNKRLRTYRAWVNDHDRAVLLEFPDRRLVISPHDPQAFVLRLRKLIAMGATA
jgi:hypothetical protein